jgi:hypothetical protein
MTSGDETANFLALDYLITIFHNIKTEEMIRNEMSDADAVTVQMEYQNIPSGSSGKSFFKSIMFPRKLKKAFYPQRPENYSSRKNPYEIKKLDGEIRFITVDVSTRANKANDNSILACVSAVPLKGKGYERKLYYMESHRGQHVGVQAQRIKELFYDFESDYIVLDLQNAGIAVFDSLSEPTNDEDRGVVYPPMTVVDEFFDTIESDAREDLRNNHTRGVNALPIIFPISASQRLNSLIATAFRTSLQKKLWLFLIGEGDAEEYLIKTNKEYLTGNIDSDISAFFAHPYVQTSLFIGECINLDMSLVGGLIKLTEKSGCFKDRYSATSYLNWIISSQFDKELLKEYEEIDDFSYIAGLVQST